MTQEELFAFSYGIRLALKAHGHDINDRDAIVPIFQRMQGIVQSPRNSLVQAHDSIPADEFNEMRQLEQNLCQAYLDGAKTNAENAEQS
jgi:hypothetical protein